VSQAELRAAFVDGWSIRSIDPAMFAVTIDDNGAQAWLATIERLRSIPAGLLGGLGKEKVPVRIRAWTPSSSSRIHWSVSWRVLRKRKVQLT